MGTRCVIAETHGKSWRGRYHHWDGYPTAVGKTLWDLYHGHFKKDLKAMLKVLLEDHPAGWSSINADWNKPIGYPPPKTSLGSEEKNGPACYCHGDRTEEGTSYITQGEDAGQEWLYVIDAKKKTLTVHKCGYGKKELGTFRLSGKEPDWKKLEKLDD